VLLPLAKHLRELGHRRRQAVAGTLCLERSLELAVAVSALIPSSVFRDQGARVESPW
jgi:hypothetical protein